MRNGQAIKHKADLRGTSGKEGAFPIPEKLDGLHSRLLYFIRNVSAVIFARANSSHRAVNSPSRTNWSRKVDACFVVRGKAINVRQMNLNNNWARELSCCHNP